MSAIEGSFNETLIDVLGQSLSKTGGACFIIEKSTFIESRSVWKMDKVFTLWWDNIG